MQLSLLDKSPAISQGDRRAQFPYPGSKRRKKYHGIYDGGDYDVCPEPFLGSGAFSLSHAHNIPVLIGADRDAAVLVIWRAWQDPELRLKVDKRIAEIKGFFADPTWAPESIFCYLKAEFEWQGNPALRGGDRLANFAAASIVLRQLVFGNYTRCNVQGKLNVALSQDKLSSFPAWQHQWPRTMPARIYSHWSHALLALKHSGYQRALVVLDPPYWVPYAPGSERRGTGNLTPAYVHHDVSGEGLFNICINSLEMALRCPNVARIVFFNYYSRPMANAVQTMARRYGRKAIPSNLGALNSSNNRYESKGRFDEIVWEIGGKRMFRDAPTQQAQQLGLLD